MRRKDREITDMGEMLAILDKCPVMRLGLSDGGQPYVVPLNFSYLVQDGNLALFFHCAAEGRKLDLIARNPQVCFEADCSFEPIRAAQPCAWSAHFESVVGSGIASVIPDGAEKEAAMDTLMARYGFAGKPHYDEGELSHTRIVKIEVTGMTGKRKM